MAKVLHAKNREVLLFCASQFLTQSIFYIFLYRKIVSRKNSARPVENALYVVGLCNVFYLDALDSYVITGDF